MYVSVCVRVCELIRTSNYPKLRLRLLLKEGVNGGGLGQQWQTVTDNAAMHDRCMWTRQTKARLAWPVCVCRECVCVTRVCAGGWGSACVRCRRSGGALLTAQASFHSTSSSQQPLLPQP